MIQNETRRSEIHERIFQKASYCCIFVSRTYNCAGRNINCVADGSDRINLQNTWCTACDNGYFVESRGILSITGGLLFLLLGVWIFITPQSIATLVPIVIGVVLLVHSLRDFQMASEAKQNGSERWGLLFLLALLNCVFGVICICDSFGVVSLAVRMLGIALVYDGISNMIIVYHTAQAIKYAAEKIEPIDVDAHEIDE